MSINNTDRERLRVIGERRREARDALKRETAALQVEVKHLVGQGMSEVEAHQLAGVTRMTIRKWLGK